MPVNLRPVHGSDLDFDSLCLPNTAPADSESLIAAAAPDATFPSLIKPAHTRVPFSPTRDSVLTDDSLRSSTAGNSGTAASSDAISLIGVPKIDLYQQTLTDASPPDSPGINVKEIVKTIDARSAALHPHHDEAHQHAALHPHHDEAHQHAASAPKPQKDILGDDSPNQHDVHALSRISLYHKPVILEDPFVYEEGATDEERDPDAEQHSDAHGAETSVHKNSSPTPPHDASGFERESDKMLLSGQESDDDPSSANRNWASQNGNFLLPAC